MATWIIAKRELRASFDSPLAYVVICLSLLMLGAFFFFMFGGGFWQADRASLVQLFVWTPRGLSLVVIPVITMRILAEEKRSGTLEMLITLPVKDHEVILGKFLAAWGLVFIFIVTTALYPLMMFWWPWDLGALDMGPVWAGYLGLILYSAAAVSIGLFISSLTDSQVIAFFITWVILILLTFSNLGLETMAGSATGARNVISYVSFDARLTPFARGVVSTRDIIYFLTITIGCLLGSFWALERRKWA